MDEIQRQLPELSSGLGVLEKALRDSGRISAELLREIYASLPSVSIDYGVMEGAEKVAVIPVDCGWSDVGSFDKPNRRSIWRHLAAWKMPHPTGGFPSTAWQMTHPTGDQKSHPLRKCHIRPGVKVPTGCI